MTSNILEEHDLDFDASVSSINSDSEKVDSLLIKRILSEMKSEFNRGTGNSDDGNENEDSSEASAMNNMDQKTILDDKNSEEGADVKEEMVDNTEYLSEPISDESSNLPIVINKKIFDAEEEEDERGEEKKPRLILTLRTSEGDREISSRTSRRSIICQSTSDIINTGYTVKNDTSITDKSDDDKGSMWESRSRRSLRSSSRINDSDMKSESSGMTRSSRRFSKEHCRESVLQSAIARKEKSFSSLSQVEERSTRRGARSPRQSPNEMRMNKPITRSKSPKALGNLFDKTLKIEPPFDSDFNFKQDDVDEGDSSITLRTETDFDSTVTKSDQYEFTDDSNDTINLNSASTNSQTSEPTPDFKPVKVDKIYTKTGKRRTKHFKGLKYSLTTGGSVVRKKSLHMSKRGRKRSQPSTTFSLNQHPVEISVETEAIDEVTNEDNSSTTNNAIITHIDKEESYNAEEEENDCGMVKNEIGSTNSEDVQNHDGASPVPGDVCHSEDNKRKYQSEVEELVPDDSKRCRIDTTSPCQADVEAEPDKPEATAVSVGVGSAGLCLCNRQTAIYAKTVGTGSDFYCQAVDSLDGRLIGCCNTVKKEDARLLRPSARVPFLVLCDVHNERLQRHNCCPGCGIFCTQGKFMQCWSYHQYHQDCQLVEQEKKLCPHCGSTEACEVNISLGAHKYPVFLPIQTPNKNMPSAKMTFTNIPISDEEKEQNLNAPIVLPDTLVLPSGLQITSQGLPAPLEKDKLEHLLHVACSVDPLSLPRYTLRNMYQAAKHGEVEKIVHMLAAGLNPNHVFREWGMGSALHAASYGGHLPVVHLLLQAGANTDVLDRDQNTPLMLACANSHNDVVKYLVKAGASVTFKGGDGMTALHLAAKAGNVEACHYLISNPNTPCSFIDSVDDGRWTPLVWAAEHKHYHVVKFLLEKRADPLVRDAEQNIALHWAALSGCIDISEALLNYGSDVNSTNAHADTPLHIAARQNAYECVILLLARGARVDMHNRAGFLPLDCVVGAPNDTYRAIKLSVELRNISLNVQKRAYKILTNDITRGHEANPVQCVNAVDDEPEPQDFVYVTENCFTSNISIDRTITSLQSCKCRDMCISGGCMCGKISIRCWYDDEGKLLPEFNFADPPMLFECNQACACNRLTCKNRVVQHGITARFQLFRTKGNKGWGVRTLRLIPKGAYVCEYIGEIISDCEADTREDDSYLFDLDNRDGETYCIDARRYGNFARFINHSCMPNLLPVRVFIDHQDLHFPRIAFFANKDIQANEELGFDYGEKFWIIKWKLFTCTCGTEKCKYSETTIEKTLANYNKKLQQEEKH